MLSSILSSVTAALRVMILKIKKAGEITKQSDSGGKVHKRRGN